MEDGDQGTISVLFTITDPSSVCNTVTISSPGITDIDSTNNTATVCINDIITPPPPTPIFDISKTVNTPIGYIGDTFTYDISFSLTGADSNGSVFIQDTRDAGLSYVNNSFSNDY